MVLTECHTLSLALEGLHVTRRAVDAITRALRLRFPAVSSLDLYLDYCYLQHRDVVPLVYWIQETACAGRLRRLGFYALGNHFEPHHVAWTLQVIRRVPHGRVDLRRNAEAGEGDSCEW